MKIIFKIAKNEIRNLCYSPVAWFLAIIFLVQCAIFYAAPLIHHANIQDTMLKNNPEFTGFAKPITVSIFLNEDGIFANALQNLFLFIPLLTMGILSREINNGTLKLLYSSPIRIREIVLGKYLALMAYNLALVGIIGIFMVSAAFQIQFVDYGMLLSATLGFYLLVCAFAAIGLFMSSLSTYQIISGIGTFLVLFALGYVGDLWQKYDFLRDLTYFLSISGRTDKMLLGLITSKDVIYFLVVIYMFLGFTLFKLRGERETKPWSVKALRYLAVVVSGVLIGYISSRPALTGYWDITAGKTNTLHPRTQKILKALDENAPLEVTMYTNLLGKGMEYGIPEARNPYLAALWEPFLRFKPDIQFKYVYYYDYDGKSDNNMYFKFYPGKTVKQIAGIRAQITDQDPTLFMPPEEVSKMIDPKAENGRLFLQMKYKGRKINLRTFNDNVFWPDERQIDDALKRLIAEKAPKIYFLSGNLERSIYKTGEREYSAISTEKLNRGSLINHAFDVDTLSTFSALSLERHNIPEDIAALVIADPKIILGEVTLAKIRQYIDKGGNLMICGEPGKQYVLNPLLKQLGVQLMKGTLVELSKNETPDKVIPYITEAAAGLAEEGALLAWKDAIRKKDTEDDSLKIVMPGVTGLSYAEQGGFTISPILKTTAQKTWLKAGTLVLDSVPPVFSPNEGDSKEASFATGVQLTRQVNNRQQRIIVCGDADFTSNMRLVYNVFGNAFYSWFVNGAYPQYLPQPVKPKDILLRITEPQAYAFKIATLWVLPGLLLVGGTLLLIRRKRK
ncbi:ABC-2 type transport system permease protein [Pedobacter africanus]|uniref:ABC-2 type transport system permease protein n=1 Tax=Pedobacter africanus TaxID=151894 RepID=A0ACC6L416_9SPHI|nr:Gldg family protein [Pedobacter africanus]MDR6786112.1 ABC-2 type transport system permease protein [Pedobacter africanus]